MHDPLQYLIARKSSYRLQIYESLLANLWILVSSNHRKSISSRDENLCFMHFWFPIDWSCGSVIVTSITHDWLDCSCHFLFNLIQHSWTIFECSAFSSVSLHQPLRHQTLIWQFKYYTRRFLPIQKHLKYCINSLSCMISIIFQIYYKQ